MAYPTVSAPYGLQPINRIDGMPYAGAFRQIPVAAGFGTAIFDGDTVVINIRFFRGRSRIPRGIGPSRLERIWKDLFHTRRCVCCGTRWGGGKLVFPLYTGIQI